MVYYRYNDEKSKELATCIQNNLNELSGLKKKVHSDDFYLFRKTLCLACLVECGFISNKEERNKLTSDIYQKMMSKQIANGIIDYLSNWWKNLKNVNNAKSLKNKKNRWFCSFNILL